MKITFAPEATFCDDDLLADMRELVVGFFGEVVNDSPHGHLEYEIFTFVTITKLIAAKKPVFGGEFFFVAKLIKHGKVRDTFKNHITTMPTRPAYRSERHRIFIERNGPFTAFARTYFYGYIIDKHMRAQYSAQSGFPEGPGGDMMGTSQKRCVTVIYHEWR